MEHSSFPNSRYSVVPWTSLDLIFSQPVVVGTALAAVERIVEPGINRRFATLK